MSAIDSAGDAWLANNGGATLTEVASAGSPLSGANGFTGGGLNLVEAVAIDALGYVWLTDAGNNKISKFNATTGAAVSGSTGYGGGGLNGPNGIAVDNSGNVWVANTNAGNSLSKFNGASGAAFTASTGFTGGGVSNPVSVAVDGAGNIWAGNSGTYSNTLMYYTGNALSVLNSIGTALSPAGGLQGQASITPPARSRSTAPAMCGAATPARTATSLSSSARRHQWPPPCSTASPTTSSASAPEPPQAC